MNFDLSNFKIDVVLNISFELFSRLMCIKYKLEQGVELLCSFSY